MGGLAKKKRARRSARFNRSTEGQLLQEQILEQRKVDLVKAISAMSREQAILYLARTGVRPVKIGGLLG